MWKVGSVKGCHAPPKVFGTFKYSHEHKLIHVTCKTLPAFPASPLTTSSVSESNAQAQTGLPFPQMYYYVIHVLISHVNFF